MKPEITYTEYAEWKLADRKIDKSFVELTMQNPEKILPARNPNRQIAQKIINNKLLRVVFEKESENVYIVVTAYYTKPERYKQHENNI